MKKLMAVVLFFAIADTSAAFSSPADVCHRASQSLECSMLHVQSAHKDLYIRYGVMTPSTPIISDILFIHGFADRLDNHGPLFEEFARNGFRVISFDLPGHGDNYGRGNDINDWTFTEMAELAARIEQKVVSDSKIKPDKFILSGWSTGGLLAVRISQGMALKAFSRQPNALILFAPGVAVINPNKLGEKVPSFMGGLVGRVTTRSLTHDPNPPHNGPIFPLSPIVQLKFSADLLLNSQIARLKTTALPTLVFIGDEKEDKYADSTGLKKWVSKELAKKSEIHEIDCPVGRHELDNEALPMGNYVRLEAARFARSVVDGETGNFRSSRGDCHL